MTYVIAQPCVDIKDKACIEECPVDCIYEGPRTLYIHPDECVDCGACEPVCPTEAIFYEDDTPEQWSEYYDVNVHFFDDLRQPRRRGEDGVLPERPPLHPRRFLRRTRTEPGAVSAPSPRPTFLGHPCGRMPTSPVGIPAASSTSPSARPSTRRRSCFSVPWPRPVMLLATRQRSARRRCARRCAGGSPAVARCRGCAPRGHPHDRERSSSPGCRPCSVWGRATWSASPPSPTATYDVGARLAGPLRSSLTSTTCRPVRGDPRPCSGQLAEQPHRCGPRPGAAARGR